MHITDWAPRNKNTLRGVFTLHFGNGLSIKDCSFHQRNGESWFCFPSIPYTDGDKVVIDMEDAGQKASLQKMVCAHVKALYKVEK